MQTPALRKRLNWWVSIILTAVISFGYGMATFKYKVFPYKQVKWLTNHLGESEPNRNNARATIKSVANYINRKSFFEINGIQAEIVMIGDSITDEAEWNELFPNQSIVNRAIDGDTTKGVLNRINSILATKAKKAFIMLGHNDFSRDENQTVENVFYNYEKIVRQLKTNGIIPYIQSTLLSGGQYRALNEKINELNLRLEALCQKEGLVYIDLNNTFAKDGVLNSAYSNDDVHLNGEGFLAWKNHIKKYLE